MGVRRIEGMIQEVRKHPGSGAIEGLCLDNGQWIPGDFFIDCTGFRALLIGGALNVGFDDWDHWLASDRAIAVQTSASCPAKPYTRSIAHSAGWQWQIPLQERVGNGIVYSSKFCSDQQAMDALLGNLPADPLTEPRVIKYKTGKRRKTLSLIHI